MKSKIAAPVTSWMAYVLTLGALFIGYLWATYKVQAPYSAFSTAVVALAGAYFAKRLLQKEEKFDTAARDSNRMEGNGKPPVEIVD